MTQPPEANGWQRNKEKEIIFEFKPPALLSRANWVWARMRNTTTKDTMKSHNHPTTTITDSIGVVMSYFRGEKGLWEQHKSTGPLLSKGGFAGGDGDRVVLNRPSYSIGPV